MYSILSRSLTRSATTFQVIRLLHILRFSILPAKFLVPFLTRILRNCSKGISTKTSVYRALFLIPPVLFLFLIFSLYRGQLLTASDCLGCAGPYSYIHGDNPCHVLYFVGISPNKSYGASLSFKRENAGLVVHLCSLSPPRCAFRSSSLLPYVGHLTFFLTITPNSDRPFSFSAEDHCFWIFLSIFNAFCVVLGVLHVRMPLALAISRRMILKLSLAIKAATSCSSSSGMRAADVMMVSSKSLHQSSSAFLLSPSRSSTTPPSVTTTSIWSS